MNPVVATLTLHLDISILHKETRIIVHQSPHLSLIQKDNHHEQFSIGKLK